MPFKLCSHILPTGCACRAVALSGRSFCPAHRSLQARLRRQLKSVRPPAIRLGPLDSRRAIVRSVSRILHGLNSGSLHLSRVECLLSHVQVASVRLKRPVPPPPRLPQALLSAAAHLPSYPPDSTINQTLPANRAAAIPRSPQPERQNDH
jgi:hypothetical protein